MSAFMVSRKHIDQLVNAAFVRNQPFYYFFRQSRAVEGCLDEKTRLGRILLAENIRSLNARYPDQANAEVDQATVEAYTHRRPERLGTVALLKLVDCYEYQACESADWEETEAAAICRTLSKHLVQSLPGYDNAAWGI